MNRAIAILFAVVLSSAALAGCLQTGDGDAKEKQQEDHSFMADPAVRRALSYAIDYNTIQEQVFQGYAQPLPGPIPQGMDCYETQNGGEPFYTYDPAQAEQILQDAGYNKTNGQYFDGATLQILYNSGNTEREQMSRILQQNLQDIGINSQVSSLNWPQFLDRMFGSTNWDIIFIGWAPDYNDPDDYWFPFAASAGVGGDTYNTGYNNTQLNDILLDAKREVDPEARCDLYAQAYDLFIQEPNMAFVGQTERIVTYRDWLQGFEFNQLFLEPGRFYPLSKSSEANNPDTFTYATFGDAASLDPADAYDTASGIPLLNAYDTLVTYRGNSSELQPGLATDWSSNENGTVWTFNLREGVKFANGNDFTAEDVAFSIDYVLTLGAPETGVSWIIEQFCEVGCVEVVDNHTVEFHLSEPYGGFLPAMAYTVASVLDKETCEAHGGMPQAESEVAEGAERDLGCHTFFQENTVGTGAYQVDQWQKGQRMTFKQNPNYWEGWDGDHVETAVVQIIEDDNTRILALKDGDVDMAEVPIERVAEVQDAPGIVFENPATLNVDMAVFQTHSDQAEQEAA